MQREQVRPATSGDPGGPPDQRLAFWPTRECDQHAFAGLPRFGDLVLVPVVLQRIVDLVGHPQQCELAQSSEIAYSEVVAECGIDLVETVDVAVRHPAAQRLG